MRMPGGRTVNAVSCERGQASVEWVALALLVAIALGALARFAARADAGHLGAELTDTISCAVRGGCEAKRGGERPSAATAPRRASSGRGPSGRRAAPTAGIPHDLVTAPPPVPAAPRPSGAPRLGTRGLTGPGARAGRSPAAVPWRRPPRFAMPLVRRGGRGVGELWRRSWMLCLAYERVRYSVRHPEIGFPGATVPMPEALRIANDCLSPVDMIR